MKKKNSQKKKDVGTWKPGSPGLACAYRARFSTFPSHKSVKRKKLAHV